MTAFDRLIWMNRSSLCRTKNIRLLITSNRIQIMPNQKISFTYSHIFYLSAMLWTHILFTAIHNSVLELWSWTAIVKRTTLWNTYVLIHTHSSTSISSSQPFLHNQAITANGATHKNISNRNHQPSSILSAALTASIHTINRIARIVLLIIFFIMFWVLIW